MLSFCVSLRCSENSFRNPNWAKHVSGISRDPQWWDSFIVSFPYYSHTTPIRIPKDMGIVWETYDKWVPLLGVPGNTSWTWTCSLLKLCVRTYTSWVAKHHRQWVHFRRPLSIGVDGQKMKQLPYLPKITHFAQKCGCCVSEFWKGERKPWMYINKSISISCQWRFVIEHELIIKIYTNNAQSYGIVFGSGYWH